jgi:hypothetical protein
MQNDRTCASHCPLLSILHSPFSILQAQTLALIAQVAPLADHIAVGKLNGHPHARTIDWVAFAHAVQTLLDDLGVRSRLKQDLRCLLPDHDGGHG